MRSRGSWGFPGLSLCTRGGGTHSSGLPGQLALYDDPVAYSGWEQVEISAYIDSHSAVRRISSFRNIRQRCHCRAPACNVCVVHLRLHHSEAQYIAAVAGFHDMLVACRSAEAQAVQPTGMQASMKITSV